MSPLRMAVFALTVVWPAALGLAMVARHGGHEPWSTVAYAAAGRICHQQPARSFATSGVQWPVCARCSGLYLAAPFGAVLGWRRHLPRRFGGRMRSTEGAFRDGWYLAFAAAPTALTLAVEWSGIVPVSNLGRAVAALPLGAAVSFIILGLVSEARQPIR